MLLLFAFLSPLVKTEASVTEGWKRDHIGWWYQNSDRTWPANSWKYINNKWYYFGQNGYMLSNTWIASKYYVGPDGDMLVNTTTPDGYRVGSDGAWIDTGNQEATPPSKSVSDNIRISDDDVYPPNVVYNGVNYNDFELHLRALDSSGAQVEDRGNYYIVHNAEIGIMENGSEDTDYFKIYSGSVYIRKNASIKLEETHIMTAEQMYNQKGTFSLNSKFLDALRIKFDSQGYITGFYGGYWG